MRVTLEALTENGVVTRFDDPFARIVDRFWPGSLTLVLPADPRLAPPVTSAEGTVAVRWTSCPAARRLLEVFVRRWIRAALDPSLAVDHQRRQVVRAGFSMCQPAAAAWR